MSTKTNSRADVAFFYEHAGWGYDPATETKTQGRRRGARALARAESWLALQLLAGRASVEWCDDPYSHGAMEGVDSGPFYGCTVRVGDESESLWAIDFKDGGGPDGDPYSRVVVAELALELMPD